MVAQSEHGAAKIVALKVEAHLNDQAASELPAAIWTASASAATIRSVRAIAPDDPRSLNKTG